MLAAFGAIAVVHETLAHTPGEKVDVDEVADKVIALVRDMSLSSRQVSVVRVGTFGILSAEIVTPLSMVLPLKSHAAEVAVKMISPLLRVKV